MQILHLTKPLTSDSTVEASQEIAVIRPFNPSHDIMPWIELRARAFRNETPAVRAWTTSDFREEILDKEWWNPQRTWVAEHPDSESMLIGSIFLGQRGQGDQQRAVIHWLMVEPTFRGRGIATALIAHLEEYGLALGHTTIGVETHTGWAAAMRLYHQLGYAAAR